MVNRDILVIAESALATSEGRLISLSDQDPSPEAQELAEQYDLDPRLAEIVLKESDEIVGGIPGFLLCNARGKPAPKCRG